MHKLIIAIACVALVAGCSTRSETLVTWQDADGTPRDCKAVELVETNVDGDQVAGVVDVIRPLVADALARSSSAGSEEKPGAFRAKAPGTGTVKVEEETGTPKACGEGGCVWVDQGKCNAVMPLK